VKPVLSESDITRERLALEESIRKVETESACQSSEPWAAARRPDLNPSIPIASPSDQSLDQSAKDREATVRRPAPPAAILKSGVVDGMHYTIYSDGSIEAELPHGTVRFASTAELRAYIEADS
jgi:hypothetical protein